jgi:hypothetical protein
VVVRYRIKTIPRLADLGAPRAPASAPPGEELLMNADVEGDTDHDGFGDETQDACPSNPFTQAACPAATTTVASGNATFSKPGRIKLKRTFTKKARKSLARKKRVRLTLKVVVTDRSGNPTTTTKRIQLKR